MTEQGDNTPVTQDDRITRYLRGGMSPDEERAFMEETKHDDALRTRAITMARLVKAMRHEGAKSDRQVIGALGKISSETGLKAKFAATGDQPTSKRSRLARLSRKATAVLSAAAAVLALCIAGGYRLYDNHEMNRLGTTYLACFPASEYDRGADVEAQASISRLYQAVTSQKDLASSIEELEQVWTLARQAEYNDFTEYKPFIGWMLANAYVLHNDKDRAVATLDALIQDPDCTPALIGKAQELKNKIEDRKLF
ncbi:MAG TPA: hypothetical protein DD401_02215 [Prevotella sp.]|nr:hypothetical protein [Prevotella sp.]